MASVATALGIVVSGGCSLVVDTTGLTTPTGQSRADASSDAPRTDGDLPDGGADASSDGGLCSSDLSIDPKNCARCGHDCLGGACISARCQPSAFIEGESAPIGIATDGTELFWSTESGSLRAKRMDGTGSIRTVRAFPSAAHIKVENGDLYVATYRDKRIVRVPVNGLSESTLATCAGNCLGVAVAGGMTYFTDRGSGSLRVVGGTSDLVTDLDNPEDVFATSNDVYVANEFKNTIVKYPRNGGSAAVPWVSVTDPVSSWTDGTVMFIVSQSGGIIYGRPLGGGTLEPIAVAQAQPTGITATTTAIYWTNMGNGRIMRLAR